MESAFQRINITFVIPLFIGALFSLFACVFFSSSYGLFDSGETAAVDVPEDDDYSLLFAATDIIPDVVLEYYRNPEFRIWVIDFFTNICSNRDIAYTILNSADEFNIPPALAFALCWEESRFNPYAINRQNRNGSIDRGLFQLNNRSFPHLEVAAFFDIDTNVRHGVGYLRYCLDTGGNEISALAMYNAGAGRVRSTGAPHVTLNYTSRILENRRKIESRFHLRLIREEEVRLVERSSQGGGLFGRAL
ncbi:MAG: lytic transglycosylase domain-containing protein [Treponema sp.]|nr:lytic transglycosylase domain-containing protein [Treponema sp.]